MNWKNLLVIAGVVGITGCGDTNFKPAGIDYGSTDSRTLEVVLHNNQSLGDNPNRLTSDHWEALREGEFNGSFGKGYFDQELSFSEGSGQIVEHGGSTSLSFPEAKMLFKYRINFTGLEFAESEDYTFPDDMVVNILGENYNISRVYADHDSKNVSVRLDSTDVAGHYMVLRDNDYSSCRFTERESEIDGVEMDTAIVTINGVVDEGVFGINYIDIKDQVRFNTSVSVDSCGSVRNSIAVPERLLSNEFDIVYVDTDVDTPGQDGCAEKISKYSLVILSE